MTQPPALFTLFGCTIRIHWTVGLSFPLVACYSFATETSILSLFFTAIILAVYFCVFLQGMMHVFMAARFGIGTRDLIVYPFWVNSRYEIISERPWQEIYLSLAGPVTHGMIAGILAVTLGILGHSAAFPGNEVLNFDLSFFVYLTWCNLLLALLHLMPILPLDMGQLFRACLSMTYSRVHATEIACNMSSIGSVILILTGAIWLHSPMFVYLAIALYLSSQEDLGRTRYFASIKADRTDVSEPIQPIMIPMDQVIDDSCLPPEEKFTGFTWNRKARLWIQWAEGQAIGANALVGD